MFFYVFLEFSSFFPLKRGEKTKKNKIPEQIVISWFQKLKQSLSTR